MWVGSIQVTDQAKVSGNFVFVLGGPTHKIEFASLESRQNVFLMFK